MKQKNTNDRNAEIDLYRFLFSMIILLHHSYQLQSASGNHILFQSGALCVDFFFILSGYFLAKSAQSIDNSDDNYASNTWAYIFRSSYRLFPFLFFSIFSCLLVRVLFEAQTLKEVFKLISACLPELLFLRMTGLQTIFINPIAWYISAMMLGKFILYPLLRWKGSLFAGLIAPIISVFIAGNFSHDYGLIGLTYQWKADIGYVGIFRAFMGLLLGCFSFVCVKKLSEVSLTQIAQIILTCIQLFSTLFILLYMHFCAQSNIDFFILALFFLIITISLSEKSLISKNLRCNKTFNILGKLSLPIYLNQGAVLLLAKHILFAQSFLIEISIYIGLTFLLSVFALYISKYYFLFLPKVKQQIILRG